MTTHHPGAPTNPLKIGAPLDEDLTGVPVPAPELQDVRDELRRAEYELIYACARHRKAWQALRRRAVERERLVDQPGMLSYLDSDPHWRKATGDVSWWRGEMDAQANTILALASILERRSR